MDLVYKLTDKQMQTYNGFQWELNVTRFTDGKGHLCSPGWLHSYSDPLLAVLLNPIHANIENPRLFLGKASGAFLNDKGLKQGYTNLTLIKELPIPTISINQKVAFAILCALEVYKFLNFNAWAHKWLASIDRSYNSAISILNALEEVRTAKHSAVVYAIEAAIDSLDTSRYPFCEEAVAYFVALAAEYTARTTPVDLIKLAYKAMETV